MCGLMEMTSVHFKIPRAALKKLQQRARREDRSVSNLLRMLAQAEADRIEADGRKEKR